MQAKLFAIVLCALLVSFAMYAPNVLDKAPADVASNCNPGACGPGCCMKRCGPANQCRVGYIGETYKVANLGAGVFASPPFPVNGHILDLNFRFMVPLVCQWAGKPNKPSVNVWFLVDTGSPSTCLTMKSLKAILGADKDIHEDQRFIIAVQDQNSEIGCQVSKAHFKEVNILGANAILDLGFSIKVIGRKNFQLIKL